MTSLKFLPAARFYDGSTRKTAHGVREIHV